MGGEIVGIDGLGEERFRQGIDGDGGVRVVGLGGRATDESGPDAAPVVDGPHEFVAAGLGQFVIELSAAVFRDLFRFLTRDAPLPQEVLQVRLEHARSLPDRLVHHGLRVFRFIAFVMAATAITVHINHHVAAELPAEVESQIHDLGDGFGVFSVHMEDRLWSILAMSEQ